MNNYEVLGFVDHTLLNPAATKHDIIELCDDAIKFSCASVCIPPSYVDFVKKYVGNKIKICTVIGFPNGYSSKETKCFEAGDAISKGADEIDMVINISHVKNSQYYDILNEINSVKRSCDGKVLKVIIETCLLTEDEKIKMCEIVSQSDADFIKTSTGFSKNGATLDDIKLMKKFCGKSTKIKAAGGISSFEDAQNFIDAGADRLGTSRLVNILKNIKTNDASY